MEGSSEVRSAAVASSTAEWRLSLSAELDRVGYRRAVKSRRLNGWFLGLVVLASCPATLIELMDDGVGAHWLLAIVAVLVALGGIGYSRSGLRVADGLRRREAFRLEHESIAGWLVDLVVLQGAAPTGRDTGVLWFDDDRLYFLGSRTSFGLAHGQVRAVSYDDWVTNDLQPPLTMTLGAGTPVGPLGLGFDVLPQAPGDFRASRTGRALHESIRGWMAASHGEDGQLPPLSIGPEAPTRLALLREAVQTTAVWVVVAALVLWTAAATFWWLAPVWAVVAMLVLIPWGGIWIPRVRWRAWRDRRRLDRSASQ